MAEPKVLLTGLGIPESPRWHEGRLWFCNWIDRQVVAVDMDGKSEVMVVRDPDSHPMGYSIDWLPDGRLLTTGDMVRRHERDGSLVTVAAQHANEIVVDGRGNIYINGADFDFAAGAPPKPGYIKLIAPEGHMRQVADDIAFPNGMVITPDDRTLIISESFARRLTAFDIDPDGGLSNRRVFAEDVAPDGITLDAEGAVWVQTAFSVSRVAEGGRVLQRVDLPGDRAPFALMLGGPDRRTLFILTAEWRLADDHVVNLDRLANGPRTGEILTLPVEVPGAPALTGQHAAAAWLATPSCLPPVAGSEREPRAAARRPRGMRTRWVRYPAAAGLVAAAAGLLLSAGAARAAPAGPAGGRLSRPQTAVTACGFLTLERVGGHVMAAGDCAGRLVLPGAARP